MLSFVCAGWFLVSYLIYKLATSILRVYHNAAKAREWECSDPPALKSRLPGSIDLVRLTQKADQEFMFPPFLQQRCHDAGRAAGWDKPAYTFKWNVLGKTGFTTNDPENIKFILAKGFNDFGLGHVRRWNFFPLLGNGIFTQDDKAWEHSVSGYFLFCGKMTDNAFDVVREP